MMSPLDNDKETIRVLADELTSLEAEISRQREIRERARYRLEQAVMERPLFWRHPH
jgi:hypothetical protein